MKNNECPVHKEGGPVCICASELSRVRGLLQRRDQDWRDLIQDAIGQWGGPQFAHFNEAMARIWEAKKQFDKGLDVLGFPLEEPPTFPQSSSLVRSGAESAESSLSSPPPLCKCGHSPAMHEATSGWTAGNSYLNCKVCPDCTRFKPAASPELLPKV